MENWNEILTSTGVSAPKSQNFRLSDTYGREWAAHYTDGTNFEICVNRRWQWPDPALRFTHWQSENNEGEEK